MTDSKPKQVRDACEQLLAAGRDITFDAVAQTAGGSRATCYRNRELRAIIDTYRSRHGELLTLKALADRVDNLTQTLDASPTKSAGKKKKSAPSNELRDDKRSGARGSISRMIDIQGAHAAEHKQRRSQRRASGCLP